MLQSMTGFGKSEITTSEFSVKVEIKSLNHKNIDVRFRMPQEYNSNEILLRKELTKLFVRGKIDCEIQVENKENISKNYIDEDVANQYYSQIEKFVNSHEQSIHDVDIFSTLLKLPEVVKTKEPETNDKQWEQVLKAVMQTAKKMNEFRIYEGKVLQEDIEKRIIIIRDSITKIEKFEKYRLEAKRTKFQDVLQNLKNIDYDKNRMEQEIIYYIEKFDITEEKVRLLKHCQYFLETVHEKNQVGKKLIFISQEIGREINTIGSKANNYEIQQIVVEMKDELEKIKEQLMNVV